MQRNSSQALSLLTPIGFNPGDCGYCKPNASSKRSKNSSASYYARAKSISPEHYQALMDRGWRRSGNLLYVPDVSRSCCPHYTIRLPAREFKPSRDQRQALHRWNRHVLGDEYINEVHVKYPKTKEERKRDNNHFDLLTAVHASESYAVKPSISAEHRFEVTLEPDNYSAEKFALFDNYQRNVHHEGDGDISRSGFSRFLCSSPVKRRTDSDGRRLGSFHQCYRLDGRLMAMAVLDLLPHAVSGVYFMYHSDFQQWSFGKLSALRETALALEEGYQYYYMGYYIHHCPKMRYKGDYKPQYVLDYFTHEWDPLDDEMRGLMDRVKVASMSKERVRRRLRHRDDTYTLTVSSDESGAASAQDATEKQDDALHPTPLEACDSGLSLLQLGIPGIMSLTQLREQIDLDRMRVHLGRGGVHEIRHVPSWRSGSELDPSTLKGVFAELAAAVGPMVAREAVVDFSSE